MRFSVLKRFFYIVPCVSLIFCVFVNAQKKTSDIIQRAMDDELRRSMTELQETGFDKPFYIGYGISDMRQYSIMATMGALFHSIETPARTRSVRVLVGDYDLNDESLDNNITTSAKSNDIDMPLDDDYFGIRRSLWVSTDNVYKNAARQYKKNAETAKADGKPLADIPHRAFANAPVIQMLKSYTGYSFDKKKWENYARQVSAVFNDRPGIMLSTVVLNFQQGEYYFTNSEGTHGKTPQGIAVLQISAQSKNAEGSISFDQLIRFGRTPDQLPSLDEMKKEVAVMADQLLASSKLPDLTEEFTGPVFLEGAALAEIMAEIITAPREGLQANNTLPDPKLSYRNEQSMDTKIGKLVTGETLTIKDVSSRTSYDGIDLLGSYSMDHDGVAPTPDLVLIEKGILKNLLNDRTITKPEQFANGHRQGPGTIQVSFGPGLSEPELKAKFIAQIKKEGLEFGLLIRDYSVGRFHKIYRVTSDGKEEAMQPSALNVIQLRALKKVIGAAALSGVYNVPSRNAANGVVSYIVPAGIVLEEATVAPGNAPIVKEEDYVSRPSD